MTTELPRDTLDLLPQGVIDCGDGRKTRFFRCHGHDGRRPHEGNHQSGWGWSRRWRPGFWSSTKRDVCFDPGDKRIRLKDCTRRKIGDFPGTAKWCFNFMKREGVSTRTWTKVARKLPAAYENQVLEFHPYVINLWKTDSFELSQIARMDEVSLTSDRPSKRTVDVQGAKTTAVKISGHGKTLF